MNRMARIEPTPPECALAAEMFDHFCSAGTMKQILTIHREICNTLNLKPNRLPDFYPKLKAKLASSWKAQALFKKFDARANHKVYGKGRVCVQSKVLIIGAGPCGLRAAIECQLLGAKVVVIEKRDRMSRNNVLHLWPFVIHDLRALGAKKFFGKFCAGSIDHICIRQLQCILLKVSLLLGVEFHEGVSFEELLEPITTENSELMGWRARVSPADHPVAQYEFDVLIGADGKRNTLQGFKRKEFRGKLAMAITANFINRHSEQEASVPEISGVAFIFNQKFFKELYEVTRIDLENIVYYKDDTHYFVMTAKKHSLLDKGVLLNDYAEVSRLLSLENVDRAALMRYAQEAARFSTDGRLPLRDFALNHYGEPDVALFDFTSMYAAENASMVYERHGRRLLCQLVGDSLLEPFWPTGSGCARGFLSALDASWAVRTWAQMPLPHPLEVIAERESIYRLLAQTTPENLQRDFGAYTLDPASRYPNLNRTAVTPHRVTSFYDSDDPLPLDAVSTTSKKRRREAEISEETLIAWVAFSEPGLRAAASSPALSDLLRRYRPDLLPDNAPPRVVYHVLHHEFGIAPFSSSSTTRDVPDSKLRSYLARVYYAFKGEVPHVHHPSYEFDQIKENIKKEKQVEQTTAMYTNPVDTEKSHSSYRKKRRSVRTPQVSNDSEEYIRKKINKLDLNDITQLAHLIDGHDAVLNDERNTDKQRELQEKILALLDPEESPDPAMLRESLTQLLQGTAKASVKAANHLHIAQFFEDKSNKPKSLKPLRKLKGLDADTIRVPDFSDIFESPPSNPEVVVPEKHYLRKNDRAFSLDELKANDFDHLIEGSSQLKQRKFSIDINGHRNNPLHSPEVDIRSRRSSSIGSSEMGQSRLMEKTRTITNIFEGNNNKNTHSLEPRYRGSGPRNTPEMTLRLQRMTEIIEGKRRDTPSPDRSKRSECIGSPEMALRKQRVTELIQGNKFRQNLEQVPKSNSTDMAFRMQRVSDIMEKRNAECKRPKNTGKRKVAREIMKQRFEKSLQMLAAEPRLDFSQSTDLQNDYGLQQYRASAPQFGERVRKLEKKLQHYEEGRAVGGGGKSVVGGGARVAQLAAELSGTTSNTTAPRANKPKDLMRSVGKIERDDWNVKEIEKKIMENRLGRPEPKTAEKVPKWDREQFLGRQKRLKEGEGNEKWGEIDKTLHQLDQKLRDSGRPDHGTKKVANLATKFVKKNEPESEKTTETKEEVSAHYTRPYHDRAMNVSGTKGIPPTTAPTETEQDRNISIYTAFSTFKKSWRGPTFAGMQCAACGTRVFAAEGVTADGLHLHRACFRCAVCKTVLRPGNYTMERYGNRLVCLRHSGVSVLDGSNALAVPLNRDRGAINTPERISLEVSDSAAREIDEDEWTDRNFLASETSCAGGLSDEEESSSDDYTDVVDSDNDADQSPEPEGIAEPRPPPSELYFSDDSFGYDDYSEDGGDSSGNESCSRMRAAREARRREVPADAHLSTNCSSEVESEEESESSDEVSSATEVSTDSEFAHEENIVPPSPPAILVTEAPHPVPPPPQEYPLSRTRSAGGLAIKRALELKRKYLLGESSAPAVRKSESASHLDTKLEAFRLTITEFQKLLNPAPTPVTNTQQLQQPVSTFKLITTPETPKSQPMPDIIKNLCNDAPLDLLEKSDFTLPKKDWQSETPNKEESIENKQELDSDSLSDDSSHTETAPNQSNVPRLEVHDEGGELIQLDSLTILNTSIEENEEKASDQATTTGPTVVAADSESSESCRDATTLALTETELSDWAAESGVLDDCGMEDKNDRKRNKDPLVLGAPKVILDAKNITSISTHVCGRVSPLEIVDYSNALEHFEFADEGEQDPSIETPITLRNEGYMELVDDDLYSPSNDRSMNFIESNCTETALIPSSNNACDIPLLCDIDIPTIVDNKELDNNEKENQYGMQSDNNLKSPQLLKHLEIEISKTNENIVTPTNTYRKNSLVNEISNDLDEKLESINSSLTVTSMVADEDKNNKTNLRNNKSVSPAQEASPPLIPDSPKTSNLAVSVLFPTQSSISFRTYSPAICRSASETFHRSNSGNTSYDISTDPSAKTNLSSGSMSPVSPPPTRETIDKVQEIKREREEQTEVVRRLVLMRLGNGPRTNKKSSRRVRAAPCSNIPPPVPPPPVMPPTPPSPPPPPRPVTPTVPLTATPSFSDPELANERRSKSIMKSISSYLNRRLGPRNKDSHQARAVQSTSALEEAPPVPPPPARYTPSDTRASPALLTGERGVVECQVDALERDAMQAWFESRWARLVAQRRARDEPANRHVAHLTRRLARPLSAEQQAATVAELVQVSAQRNAHQALMEANRRRSAGGSLGE